MAYPQETRDKLRRLYAEGQSLETAAELSGVSFGTARRWREEARADGIDWDKQRAAYTLAGGGIEQLGRAMMAGFLQQYGNTMELLQDDPDLGAADKVRLLASLADAFTKTVSANSRILPETSRLATALETVSLLVEFTAQTHPQALVGLAAVLDGFKDTLADKMK